MDKEVIFKEDLELIFGKRPFDKEEQPLIKTHTPPPATEVKNPVAKVEEKNPPTLKASEDKEEKNPPTPPQADSEDKEKKEEPPKANEPEKPLNTLF